MPSNEKGHEFYSAKDARERVAASIGSSDYKEKSAWFDKWAPIYDDDMIALGYNGYEAMSKRITMLVQDKNVKILDVGCGTGRFGQELQSLGYSNIYGVDASDSFLDESRKRGVYVDLKNSRFGANIKTPYDDGSFDVVMAVSVFVPGTIDHTALPEINRITASGGYLMAFMRRSKLDMEREDFNVKGVFEEWAASGQWERLPDVNTIYYGNRLEEGDKAVENTGVVVTLRKLFI